MNKEKEVLITINERKIGHIKMNENSLQYYNIRSLKEALWEVFGAAVIE